MAAEGEFPKADGDILYASEANRFASAGRFVEIGSTGVASGSSNTYTEVGSVVIGAGSLSNPCQLTLQGQDGSTRMSVQIEVSGTSTNASFVTQDGTSNQRFGDHYVILCGSPFNGNALNLRGADTSGTVINDLDTGSPVVIKFSIRPSAAGDKFWSYGIQSFRGNI